MAQLKKAVTERHQQQKQPELLEEGGASAESATNGITTFNTNSNNNNNSPPTVVVEGDVRMGRHSVSGDLPRPKTAPSDSTSARRGSLTDIFVAKSTLPTLREEEGEGRSLTPEPPKSARRLRWQRHFLFHRGCMEPKFRRNGCLVTRGCHSHRAHSDTSDRRF